MAEHWKPEDCVECETCGEPMVPNLSTGDEEGYGWSCINIYCEEGVTQFAEVEPEDLVAIGLPFTFAKMVVRIIDTLHDEQAKP